MNDARGFRVDHWCLKIFIMIVVYAEGLCVLWSCLVIISTENDYCFDFGLGLWLYPAGAGFVETLPEPAVSNSL